VTNPVFISITGWQHPMAGDPPMTGDHGSPHRGHHLSPRLILRKEKLRANSTTLEETNQKNHTRLTATRSGGGAIAAPSATFKTSIQSFSTSKKGTGRKRRRQRTHQRDEKDLQTTRLHPAPMTDALNQT
jgi:hypothetical protein